MAENIILNRNAFNKDSYPKVINTKFEELGVSTIEEQIQEQPSVQEFFNLYNELFFQINALGPTNSHEYLIKTSSDYVGFDENNEIIELLQAEIAGLRQDLLESQKQLADVQLNPTLPTSISSAISNTPNVESSLDPSTFAAQSIPQPSPSSNSFQMTNEQRVIADYKTYPDSSKKERANRLNLSKEFITNVKNANNL